MPYVYVPNKGPHDYHLAEAFGQLVFCTEGPLDKLDISQMYRLLAEAFEGSVPEDMILITSLSSLCSVASAIFAERHHVLNLLIFHNDQYIKKTIFFN